MSPALRAPLPRAGSAAAPRPEQGRPEGLGGWGRSCFRLSERGAQGAAGGLPFELRALCRPRPACTGTRRRPRRSPGGRGGGRGCRAARTGWVGAASAAAENRAVGAQQPRARPGEQLPRRRGERSAGAGQLHAPSEYGPATPGRRAGSEHRLGAAVRCLLRVVGFSAVSPGKPRSPPAAPWGV